MRAPLAVALLAAATLLPRAARADTVQVMTVTGNGHTWTFDFPLIQTFTYPTNLPLFVPVLTPLSETFDGASVTPEGIYVHAGQNILGSFGQLITNSYPLDILSSSGPYGDPFTRQSYYDIYTATWFPGGFGAYGTFVTSTTVTYVPYSFVIQQQTTAPTPEPPAFLLLATAGIAVSAWRRRLAHP
ncbi:MAG TPA: hypothetical protein VM865_00595 [Acidobacteriaceae bacterium]|jgi:hypothetical protein|nr:hypothetical protein [Acidobacteriaceae bacterium]